MNIENKNLIGTDVNINTCIAEGYLIVDTEGHPVLQLDYSYKVTRTYPEYAIRESNKSSVTAGLMLDTSISWNDLIEIYNKHKKDLDSYADDLPQVTKALAPSFHDFLALADSIDSYYGI